MSRNKIYLGFILWKTSKLLRIIKYRQRSYYIYGNLLLFWKDEWAVFHLCRISLPPCIETCISHPVTSGVWHLCSFDRIGFDPFVLDKSVFLLSLFNCGRFSRHGLSISGFSVSGQAVSGSSSHDWPVFRCWGLVDSVAGQLQMLMGHNFRLLNAQCRYNIATISNLKKCSFWRKNRFCATCIPRMINHLHSLFNRQYGKKKEAFSTLIGTFILGVKKRTAASKQPP